MCNRFVCRTKFLLLFLPRIIRGGQSQCGAKRQRNSSANRSNSGFPLRSGENTCGGHASLFQEFLRALAIVQKERTGPALQLPSDGLQLCHELTNIIDRSIIICNKELRRWRTWRPTRFYYVAVPRWRISWSALHSRIYWINSPILPMMPSQFHETILMNVKTVI